MNYGKMVFMSMVMTVVLLIMIIGTLRNYDGDDNENVTIGLISKTTTLHNSARASRFFVHFFVIPAQVRREMANFTFT